MHLSHGKVVTSNVFFSPLVIFSFESLVLLTTCPLQVEIVSEGEGGLLAGYGAHYETRCRWRIYLRQADPFATSQGALNGAWRGESAVLNPSFHSKLQAAADTWCLSAHF